MGYSDAAIIGCGRTLTVLFLVSAGALPQTPELSQRLQTARHLKQLGQMLPASQAYESLLSGPHASGDGAILAQAFFESSQVALALGAYPRAVERATEAAGLFRKQGDGSGEARATNNVGLAYLYRGDYLNSLQYFQRSLDLHKTSRNAEGEVTLLNNIGNVYFFRGQYADALHSYELALQRVDESQGEAWNLHRRGLTLTNLATLYEQLGQNDRALSYFLQARAAGRAAPPSEQAQLLSNLGTLYRRLGDPAKALETYAAAEQLFSLEHHSDGEIHIQENIGIALALDYGDLAGALRAFTKSLQLANSTGNRRQAVLAHLFRGEALARMARVDDAQREFETALAGARSLGAAEEQWTAEFGLGRTHERRGERAAALGFFGEAIAVIESVRSGLGTSSLKAEFLANKRDVYDAYIDLLLQSGAPLEQLFAVMEQARSRNLKDALRDKDAQHNASLRASLSSIKSRLSAGSMMIEYWVGRKTMSALWLTPQNAGIVTRPIPPDFVKDISELSDSLWGSARTPDRDRMRRMGDLLLTALPVQNAVRHVLIVPDGILQNVPFEMLQADRSGSPLIEHAAISYLPSALFLKHQALPAKVPPWRLQLVAFGDPAVPAQRLWGTGERWSAMPESSNELASVAGALRGRAEVHRKKDDLKHYLIEGRAAGVPLLHFSTHAVADTDDPTRSRLLFTREKTDAGSEFLFWREVQDLKLGGVELVTLSACDTEGGKLTRGEGIQNFSRAFLQAGADATVTTLWRVADAPTAELMKRFYGHLARGESKAEALRAAKLSFLHSGSKLALPRYWAAFVLNGDGQLPIRPVWSWGWLLTPLGVLVLAAALLLRFRARAPA